MRKEFFYCCLLMTLAYNMLYRTIPQELVSWHPFFEIEYNQRWYFALFQYNLKPVLYLMALLSYKEEKVITWFLAYEIVFLLDFIFFYSQLPFRTHTSIFMGIVTIGYYVYDRWKERER